MFSIEDQKKRLQKGIDSPATPDHVKEEMRVMLHELENPTPEPVIEPPKKKKKKGGNPLFQKGKANPYYKGTGITPWRKLNVVEPIVEPPPPPPERVFTAEEKQKIKDEYDRRRERKKSKLY